MNRLIKWIIVLAASVFLLCSIVFALQYNNQPNNNAQTESAPHVMTPEEFANKVNAISQQTKTTLAQETNQILPKQAANPSMVPPPVTTPPPSAVTTTTTSTTPTATAPMSAPPISTPPPMPVGQTSPTQPLAAPPPPPTTSTVTTAPASQSQTYMGFGTGETNQTTNTNKKSTTKSPAEQSGGWNIHY